MDAGYAKIANDAIHVVIPIFCVATMFAIGLDVTMSEAMAPLRQMLALGTVVLVNNVLIPLLGFVIIAMPAVLAINWFASLSAEIVPLTGGAQLGFLLLILASGSMLAPLWHRLLVPMCLQPKASCSSWSSRLCCWCRSNCHCYVGLLRSRRVNSWHLLPTRDLSQWP